MPPRPRLGVQLPEVEREVRWPEYAAMALAAEDAGFDSIWVGDHYLYRGDGRPERGPWEAWTLLAALATVTQRVRLGPLVACLNFHPPAVLAKIAATVDEVSGGRLILGLGAGWNRAEFDAFGIPYDHRASRFEESFEIIRRLLDGERVTFAGRWHSTSDAILLPKPVGRPTLMVGSTGPRVLAGRDPATLERSACVLVRFPGGAGERPDEPGIEPVDPSGLGAALAAFVEAGADEVILVCDPITEGSIRA